MTGMLPGMARQRLRPLKNTALHEAITTAGWSYADTAKAINLAGAENNILLTYRAASVAHWLAGVTPRPETIPIAVEAFARALGRSGLQAADLGWQGRRPGGVEVRPLTPDLLVCSTVAETVMRHARECETCRARVAART